MLHTPTFTKNVIIDIITGPPTHSVGDQTNNDRRCLSSSVVCNAAGGRAGRPPGAWAVRRPILHGGPIRLRPVRATPCLITIFVQHCYEIVYEII